MNPETHLLASWVIAAKTTSNQRDCRLVTLAGILPDADGLGIVPDLLGPVFGHRQTFFYPEYHHYVLHGVFGAVLITCLLTCFARQKLRVALLSFGVFHLHLLCDLVGSRGPSPQDLWPIYYLGPFSRDPVWFWKGQWRLDGWQNRLITLALFAWALWLPLGFGYSVVGVFNRRWDQIFVEVLRKWERSLTARFSFWKV